MRCLYRYSLVVFESYYNHIEYKILPSFFLPLTLPPANNGAHKNFPPLQRSRYYLHGIMTWHMVQSEFNAQDEASASSSSSPSTSSSLLHYQHQLLLSLQSISKGRQIFVDLCEEREESGGKKKGAKSSSTSSSQSSHPLYPSLQPARYTA